MRLKIGWAVIVPAILAITLLLPQASYAIPVTGGLHFGGGVDVELDGTVTTIDFDPEDTGLGQHVVLPNSDGDFAGLVFTPGTILDLNDTDHPTGTVLNVPFLTFSNPDIVFNLLSILPGNFSSTDCLAAPAAGQVCTPAGAPSGVASPFEFVNISATASVVSFQVTAEAIRVSTGEVTPYTGSFSATFNDQNFQSLLSTFVNQGEIATGYDADFTPGTIIPEPSTMNLLIGALFVGVGAITRKRFLGRT
jgi:hypothetical protein